VAKRLVEAPLKRQHQSVGSLAIQFANELPIRGNAVGHRLLQQDTVTRFNEGLGVLPVLAGRGGDDAGRTNARGNQFLDAGEGTHSFLRGSEFRRQPLGAWAIAVDEGYEAALTGLVRNLADVPGMRRADPPEADYGDSYRVRHKSPSYTLPQKPNLPTWPRVLRNLGPAAPGKRSFVTLMRDRYPGIGDFNRAYQTAFSSFDQLLESPGWSPMVRSREVGDAKDIHAFLMKILDRYYTVACAAVRTRIPVKQSAVAQS